MTDDLFLDLWQAKRSSGVRAGPLVPTTYQIRDAQKQLFIKQEISRLWRLDRTRKNNPAPMPVSIDRSALPLLRKNRYAVMEKTDGVRYLLLLTQWPRYLGGQPVAVMSSRKYDMYEVRVMAEEDYFRGTLFDGELVWEYEGGQFSPPRHVFLVFDLVAVRGVSQVSETYIRRYAVLSDILDCQGRDITQDPRRWIEYATGLAEAHKVVCEGNQYCMCFRPKQIMSKEELGTVWRTRRTLRHKSDGLIFTPIEEPVRTGTHPEMFKWKSQHTIDVLWRGEYDGTRQVWDWEVLYADGAATLSGSVHGIKLDRPADVDYPHDRVPLVILPADYSEKVLQWHRTRGDVQFSHIVECACKLPTLTEWLACVPENASTLPVVECTVLKIRHDKGEPNQRLTIERTLNNILENITIHELIQVVT